MANHIDSAPGKPTQADAPGAPNAPITPVDFTPLGKHGKRERRQRQLWWPLTGIFLLMAAAVLWFLSTAQAVVIEVEPTSTTVNIDGGFNLRLAEHFLMRRGNYRLKAKAKGYQPFQQTLLVDDKDNQRHLLTLIKLPGHLEINTLPEGASVTIDGKARGMTPLVAEQLKPGNHQVSLQHPRYLAVKQAVDIEGLNKTQTLTVELQPAWGDISIASEPSGAAITVAGAQKNTTPATVTAVHGQELSLSLPGRKPWKKIIEVAPGQQLDLGLITLPPADALLNINTQPAGASITVDDEYRGVSPLKIELSPEKNHKIKLFLAGYQSATRTMTLTSGSEDTLDLALTARLGTVNISVQPQGATLYIHGKAQGRALDNGITSLRLPARPHLFKVEKNGYLSEQKTITPKPGVMQSLSFTLQTPEQQRVAAIPASLQSPGGQTLKLFRPNISFTMGAPRREQGRRANEGQRTVTLSKPFYLSVKEVTNSEFKKYRSSHSSSNIKRQTLDTGKQPVVRVSWNDAALYCNWLSEQEGLEPFYQVNDGKVSGNISRNTNNSTKGYRLPTEAEWAWAARVNGAGAVLKYSWGNNFPPPPKTANIADHSALSIVGTALSTYRDGFSVSAPVGSFPANPKGLFDLGGNVAEWVHDYYGIGGPSKTTDPLGPETGQYHVIRGPGWRHSRITKLRLSYRDYAASSKSRDDLGFRVARYLN